jgi:hypothetical protein
MLADRIEMTLWVIKQLVVFIHRIKIKSTFKYKYFYSKNLIKAFILQGVYQC